MDVLRRKNTVLKCYSNMAETVSYSEIGMSMAIIEAGFNIDSLMLRYQVKSQSYPGQLTRPFESDGSPPGNTPNACTE